MQNATKSLCKAPLTLFSDKSDDGRWIPSEISFSKTTSCYSFVILFVSLRSDS